MKQKIKVIIALIMVLAFSFEMTGCGKEKEEAETTGTTSVITTETTVQESTLTTYSYESEPTTQKENTGNITTTEKLQNETEEETTVEETSQQNAAGVIPKEVMDKIKVIYGKASIGPQTVTTVSQLAILTSISQTIKGMGPITITPARLNGRKITLLTLGGTQLVDGQATTIEESALASQGKTNDYLKAVVKLIENGTVPKNKPMLVTGISLGGMIAQQIVGEQELLKSKNIELLGVITFGSPLTQPIERYGVKVVRFADKNDMVPKLGESAIYQGLATTRDKKAFMDRIKKCNEREEIIEKSKYTSPIETHALSYVEDSCWEKYDFFGSTEKNNVLVLDKKLTFYPAPKLN